MPVLTEQQHAAPHTYSHRPCCSKPVGRLSCLRRSLARISDTADQCQSYTPISRNGRSLCRLQAIENLCSWYISYPSCLTACECLKHASSANILGSIFVVNCEQYQRQCNNKERKMPDNILWGDAKLFDLAKKQTKLSHSSKFFLRKVCVFYVWCVCQLTVFGSHRHARNGLTITMHLAIVRACCIYCMFTLATMSPGPSTTVQVYN